MNSLYRSEVRRSTDEFVSHNWGSDVSYPNNHHRVPITKKKLKEHSYQTWFDEEMVL